MLYSHPLPAKDISDLYQTQDCRQYLEAHNILDKNEYSPSRLEECFKTALKNPCQKSIIINALRIAGKYFSANSLESSPKINVLNRKRKVGEISIRILVKKAEKPEPSISTILGDSTEILESVDIPSSEATLVPVTEELIHGNNVAIKCEKTEDIEFTNSPQVEDLFLNGKKPVLKKKKKRFFKKLFSLFCCRRRFPAKTKVFLELNEPQNIPAKNTVSPAKKEDEILSTNFVPIPDKKIESEESLDSICKDMSNLSDISINIDGRLRRLSKKISASFLSLNQLRNDIEMAKCQVESDSCLISVLKSLTSVECEPLVWFIEVQLSCLLLDIQNEGDMCLRIVVVCTKMEYLDKLWKHYLNLELKTAMDNCLVDFIDPHDFDVELSFEEFTVAMEELRGK